MLIDFNFFCRNLENQGFKDIRTFWNELKKNNCSYDQLSTLLDTIPRLEKCLFRHQIKCVATQDQGIQILSFIEEHKLDSFFSSR